MKTSKVIVFKTLCHNIGTVRKFRRYTFMLFPSSILS